MDKLIHRIGRFVIYPFLILRSCFRWYIQTWARFGVLFPILSSYLRLGDFRVFLWRLAGCKMGKNVNIGWDVYYDVGNAKLITCEDDVWIASRVLLLCHKRDMSGYYKNERYNDLPHVSKPITIKKGACVSMGAMIMPGVKIGEGAVVGANALVTKDVPAWTIVAGSPAKVIKELKERSTNYEKL